MKKIYKKKGDANKTSLDEKLKSYAQEKIQIPLNSLLKANKGSLAMLTSLAAASLLSTDINAQCGLGSAVFDPSGGEYYDGQLDVDGDGVPDFDFDIASSYLYMTPIGTMSLGVIPNGSYSNVNVLASGDPIDGAGSYGGAYFYYFATTVTTGASSTVYVPITSDAGNLGFIEITLDGNGGFTVDVNQTGVANAPGTVTAGDCESLNLTVPVSLVSFEATSRKDEIALSWKTASELNNQGFEIQRSSDGENFYKESWVTGSGTVNNQVDYGYVDKSARPNVVYYYRLKQVDLDGKFKYSDIINAKIEGQQLIEVNSVYPNPLNISDLTVEINSKVIDDLSFELYDAFGKVIISNTQTLNQGLNAITIETTTLSNGTYFMKLNANNFSEYKKIVIQK